MAGMAMARGGSKAWHGGLWLAQLVLALAYGFFGWLKLTRPLAELAPMMKWVPDFPEAFVRGLGAVEILGAIGLVLPALLRIRPRLTVVTAIAILAHQACAIGLHASRGEFAALPLNLVLVGLAAVIAIGRARRGPIPARG